MSNVLNISKLSGGGKRSSNLELYRIICMLAIVAHHYVVHRGGSTTVNVDSLHSAFLSGFGMWGKTGINCFLMITGYFMCKSEITIKKFIKLCSQILTYRIFLFIVFLLFGLETVSIKRLIEVFFPISNYDFASRFLVFWLTIPFWNILIKNMTQRQHLLLTALMLLFYTILGSVPGYDVSFNYVTWFGVIYLIASYIRMYPQNLFNDKRFWMIVSLTAILIGIANAIVTCIRPNIFVYVFGGDYSYKLLPIVIAVSSFLWFKNINIGYSRIINIIGGTTFGIFLIHDNSVAMRQWLWQSVINSNSQLQLPLSQYILFSIASVLVVFMVCSAVERLRQLLIEKPMFKWFDKANIIQRIDRRMAKFTGVQC